MDRIPLDREHEEWLQARANDSTGSRELSGDANDSETWDSAASENGSILTEGDIEAVKHPLSLQEVLVSCSLLQI